MTKTFEEAPDVLKVDQAASLLGLGRNTLYSAIRRGEFPALRVGNRVMVSKRVLLDMLGATVAA